MNWEDIPSVPYWPRTSAGPWPVVTIAKRGKGEEGGRLQGWPE